MAPGRFGLTRGRKRWRSIARRPLWGRPRLAALMFWTARGGGEAGPWRGLRAASAAPAARGRAGWRRPVAVRPLLLGRGGGLGGLGVRLLCRLARSGSAGDLDGDLRLGRFCVGAIGVEAAR